MTDSVIKSDSRLSINDFPADSGVIAGIDKNGNNNSQNSQPSKKDVNKIIKEVSLGVCGTLVDITLFLTCFGVGFFLSNVSASGGRSPLGPLKAMLAIYPDLRIRLRNALHLAIRDGLIAGDELTDKGINKLKTILPTLKRQPKWSGSLWLVTYDIAEKRKKDRELIRKFLILQGYGKLQDSVYLAPFDPTDDVKTEVKIRSIKGEILISKMGTDGHIGEMTVPELISKVYNLNSVKTQYETFIYHLSTVTNPAESPLLFLEYLAALKNDPQLPKELLPVDWPGDKAYSLIRTKVLPHLVKDNQVADRMLRAIDFHWSLE